MVTNLTKVEFGEELESIAQTKIMLSKLETDEIVNVEKIRSIERQLLKIRAQKCDLESLMMNKCDVLFNRVYDQLPGGSDGETNGAGKETGEA